MTWTAENEKRMRADIAASEQIAREQGIPPRRVTLTHEDAAGALGEIERLTGELAVSTAENASLMQSSLDEIGRLTTALEQRRAPADASLEARALRDLFTKLVHVDHMARHLCENGAIDHTVDPANPTAAVDPDDLAELEEALSAVDPDEGHDEQTRARMMAVFDAADAGRPGLTEEQARRGWFLAAAWARLAQARGGMMQLFDEDGEKTKSAREWLESIGVDVTADPPVVIPEALRDKGHITRPGAPCPICRRASLEAALHDPETAEGAAAILEDMPLDQRPTPAGLAATMYAAQQRPSAPPMSPFGEWPDAEADERDPISLGERLPAAREPIAP